MGLGKLAAEAGVPVLHRDQPRPRLARLGLRISGGPVTLGKAQELRYALFGSPDASRTLLVFNGIGASLETIEPFASQFRDTRIVSFDVPGVGGSPAPALPYRFTWIARLAARLLDALDIAQIDVFGVSWGGAPASGCRCPFPSDRFRR